MARQEENDSLLNKKYLVMSLDRERYMMSANITTDLSNVDRNDYIHNTEAMDICPVTITTTKQRAKKKFQIGKSSWMKSCTQYFVLDKEQLGQMVIGELCEVKMDGDLIIMLKRRDDGYYHNMVIQEDKLIHNTRWQLKNVDGYFFITWYDIGIDRIGKKDSTHIKYVTGTKFYSN